jgi:hypothetical protein
MDHLPADKLCKEVSLIREYIKGHGITPLTYFEYEHMVEVLDNVLNYIAKAEIERQ